VSKFKKINVIRQCLSNKTLPIIFTIELKAKDGETAESKAIELYEKLDCIAINHQKSGKFDVDVGDFEVEVEEDEWIQDIKLVPFFSFTQITLDGAANLLWQQR
jgi:hypothetical protein